MTLQEIGITISAYDHSGQALGKVTSYFAKLKKEITGAWHEGRKLSAVMKGLSAGGNMAIGTGAALGAGLGFRQMAEDAGRAEHDLAQLGNIASMSRTELAKVQQDILGMSGCTNQSQAELLAGLTALMGRGMGKDDALQVLESIGKTSTATGASVENLAKTVFTATSTMKMPLNQVGQLFDSLAQAGKEGSFELKDMAKAMPELAAKAANLGMAGHKGMVQLAAWGQIAKMGTDDPAVAANNLANFLDKVTGKEAVANFAKHGIDLRAATSQAWASGDFIGTMLQIIQRDTKGDTFKLNELFGDVQVKNFLAPALQHLDEYRKIASKSMLATGVVNQDYDRMMNTFMEKAKKLKIQMAEAFIPRFGPWMDRAGKLFDFLNRHPKLFAAAINTAVGLVGAGVVMKVGAATIGTLQGVGTAAIKAHSLFSRFAASNALVRNAMIKGIPWIKSLAPAFLGAGKAASSAGVAFMSTPVGWITAAVVALIMAGVLLWKNWDKVAGWFKRTFPAVAAIFSKAWAQCKTAFIDLWSALKPLLSDLWGQMKGAFGALMTALQPLMPLFKKLWTLLKPVVLVQLKVLLAALLIPVAAAAAGLWLLIKTLTVFAKWINFCVGVGKKLLGFFKDFYSPSFKAGVGLLEAFTKGIASVAMKPVEMIKKVVTKIRRLLPFSPAKDGPLKDIHRIRLVETIAEGIKPTALISKMTQVSRALVPTLALAVPATAAAGRAPITIHLTVSVQGSAQDGRRLAQEMMPEIIRQLELHQDRQAYRSHR